MYKIYILLPALDYISLWVPNMKLMSLIEYFWRIPSCDWCKYSGNNSRGRIKGTRKLIVNKSADTIQKVSL